MTLYELRYRLFSIFFNPLNFLVNRKLQQIVKTLPPNAQILDVGGRRSPYTIGLKAEITISELPRENEIQRSLDLGITEDIIQTLKKNRSNIKTIIFDDMSHSKLSDASFDCIVAIEVLEHVEEDDVFLQNVQRVLKPNGVFLMTTPNGDYVVNTNPDHKRHYTQAHLKELVERYFSEFRINYGISTGILHQVGWMGNWTIKRPVRTIAGMLSNIMNLGLSSIKRVESMAQGTGHHFIIAKK